MIKALKRYFGRKHPRFHGDSVTFGGGHGGGHGGHGGGGFRGGRGGFLVAGPYWDNDVEEQEVTTTVDEEGNPTTITTITRAGSPFRLRG